MAYPDNIDSFSTKVDNQDDVMANHINQAQNAITAIENELGTNPKGTKANVKTRISDIETDLTTNYAKKDGSLQTNLNAQKLNSKLYNQLAYEVYRDIGGAIQYEASNIATNNTVGTVPYGLYSNEWQDTGKNITVDCTNANFIKVDFENVANNNSGSYSVYLRLVNDATGIAYAEGSATSPSNGTYGWGTSYADVSGLTGNVTFSVQMRINIGQSISFSNRGLDIHKNSVRLVRWV